MLLMYPYLFKMHYKTQHDPNTQSILRLRISAWFLKPTNYNLRNTGLQHGISKEVILAIFRGRLKHVIQISDMPKTLGEH